MTAFEPAGPASRRAWLSDSGWLLGANLTRYLGLIAVMVILTQLMTPEIVGQYTLSLAIATPIFVFAQLGLRGVYLTHRHDFPLRDYLGLQLVFLIGALFTSAAVAWLFDPTLVGVVVLVGLVKFGDAISELFSAPLQGSGSTSRIFVGFAASALAGGIAAAGVLYFTRILELTLAALALASALAALFLMWLPAMRSSRKPQSASPSRLPNMADIRGILKAGLPFGAGSAVLALVASIPQFFLALTWGNEAVAKYAVLYYLVMIADIFVGTLVQGWIPRARSASASTELAPQGFLRFTFRTAFTWSAALLGVGAFGVWVASFAYPWVFGPVYGFDLSVAIPIVAAITVLPILGFSSMGIIVQNLYTHSLVLGLISAFTSALFCALLIPGGGLVGAFWALAISSAARAAPAFYFIAVGQARGSSGITRAQDER